MNFIHDILTETVKSQVSFFNAINGCDVYSLNTEPENKAKFIYIPYFSGTNTPVVESVDGYTKLFPSPANRAVFPNLDGIIDFTNGGTNTEVPLDLNEFEIGDTPVSYALRFGYRERYLDGVLIGVDRIWITNKDADPQSGACQLKTFNWSEMALPMLVFTVSYNLINQILFL